MTFRAQIGQKDYTGFNEVTLTESLDTICRGFTLTAAISGVRPFSTSASVVLFDGAETMLNGWIDTQTERITADEYTLTISGRDSLGDIVDSTPSGVAPTAPAKLQSEFKNINIIDLANKLLEPFSLTAVFAIGVALVKRASIFNATISPGESVFQSIERHASNLGLLMRFNAQNKLEFFEAGFAKADARLVLGENLKEFSYTDNQSGLHSEYTLLSQKNRKAGTETGSAVTSISYTHLDDSITRHRPKVFTVSTPLTTDGAKIRAIYEANIRHGRAVTATATVVGWNTDTGYYWRAGDTVDIVAPRMEINGELLIKSVTRSMTKDDKTTTLELCRVGSYMAEPDTVKTTDKKHGTRWKKIPGDNGETKYLVPA